MALTAGTTADIEALVALAGRFHARASVALLAKLFRRAAQIERLKTLFAGGQTFLPASPD